MYKLVCPIYIDLGRKTYSLNINGYRNWHYIIQNKLKIAFKEYMKDQLLLLPKLNQGIEINLGLYLPSTRDADIPNYECIVMKFLLDAMKEYGIIEDDNFTIVSKGSWQFLGIDRDNPRAEINIFEIPKIDKNLYKKKGKTK